MAKDSLTDAIFELKDRGRKTKSKSVKKPVSAKVPVRLERPRAFDSFHVFSLMLLGLGIALQVVALVVYA